MAFLIKLSAFQNSSAEHNHREAAINKQDSMVEKKSSGIPMEIK